MLKKVITIAAAGILSASFATHAIIIDSGSPETRDTCWRCDNQGKYCEPMLCPRGN